MPRLLIQIDETVEEDGEDRCISGFAFQIRLEPTSTDEDQTYSQLHLLVPYFIEAIKNVLADNFGNPVASHLALIPPEGVDPLPTIQAMIGDYRATKDAFPPELDLTD